MDYARQMDAVLEVIGVGTREHAEPGSVDSLRQWSAVQRQQPCSEYPATSLSTCTSPLADSALGDEIEEAVEATEYVDISQED